MDDVLVWVQFYTMHNDITIAYSLVDGILGYKIIES